VDPRNPADLLLIDCGEYNQRGRLVNDLALIECDIKLVLLGSDPHGGKFFDIDPAKLKVWRKAEDDSIRRGLDRVYVLVIYSPMW
jgi:hypothetical protein